MNYQRTTWCVLFGWLLSPALAWACLLCSSQGHPLSKEMNDAKLVVFGRIIDARLGADGIKGTSDFQIETLLRGDRSAIKDGKIVLPRYVPPVPGVKYVIFLDVSQGQFDPYRSIVCTSDRLVQYLKKMPTLTGAGTPAERQARLKYVFDYFQDSEPELAADAYKEWSVATNQDVAAVAGQMDADKLRRWIMDPKTPNHTLALFSYLLGASGQQADLVLLQKLALSPPEERYSAALDGILAGIQRLDREQVWTIARTILTDTRRSFTERYAVLRFLRFQYVVDRNHAYKQIVACFDPILDQPEMMDLAIEQLRQWQCWEHQVKVIKKYESSANQAPITKRAIVKYALKCPGENARLFIARIRQQDADFVRDVEESLELLEKP